MAASSSTTMTRPEEMEPLRTGEEVEIARSVGPWSTGKVISINEDDITVEIKEEDGRVTRKRVPHEKIGLFIKREGETDNQSLSGQTMAASENFEPEDGQTLATLMSTENRLNIELANAKTK